MKRQNLGFLLAAGLPLLVLSLLVILWKGDQERPVKAPTAAAQQDVAIPKFYRLSNKDAFATFSDWAETYRASSMEQKKVMLDSGVAFAKQRAVEMGYLIETDPAEALDRSMTHEERNEFPDEIRDHLEKPFSRQFAMDVFPLCNDLESHGLLTEQPTDGQRRQNARIELLDLRGNTLDGYVYGRRSDPISRSRIPLQGIELLGKAALREEMFTRILPHEVADVRKRYILGEAGTKRDFLSGEEIEQERILALSGGRLFAFSSIANLESVNRSAAKLEEMIGMETGSQLLLTARLTLGHDPIDLDEVEEEGEALAITSNTTRTAIVILVDFSDKMGTPINATTLQNRFDGEVHDQVAAMSYYEIGIDATVDPRVFRMPQPTTYYNGNDDGQKKNGDLFNHAIAAANTAGLVTTGYTHRCVIFKGIGMGYCGLATVGGNKIWLPCHGSKVIVHELGHNFTLSHASYWDATTADPVGDGNSVEYGDNTSIMGGGGVPNGHFHVQAKRKINYLPSSQQQNIGEADSSQVVRIYRHDHVDADITTGKRAVRLKKGDDEFYWISYRQLFTGNNFQNYLKGVQIHWEKQGKSKSWMLDMDPSSTKNDAGLAIGLTYTDPVADTHITPLKRGGGAPNQWIDVEVNVGAYPGNLAPTGTINLPARYAVNSAVPIGSAVTDANSDPLAFHFGTDGKVMGNDATLIGRNYAWTSTGTKIVEMTATDRKGGKVSDTGTVIIQNTIPTPTNFSASDSEHFDRIELSWNAVSGATLYAIYRSEPSSAFGAIQVGTASSGTSWADTTTMPGDTYTYFVQALGSNTASAFSSGDEGTRAEGPPISPTDLQISQNEHSDRIDISWQGGGTATAFEIFRSASDDFGAAVSFGETANHNFSDTATTAGTIWFYWVRAKNEYGSADSTSASGSRKLVAPGNFVATQGGDPDSVALSWDSVENFTHYEVQGGMSPDSVDMALGTTGETFFIHSPPNVLDMHYYQVRAVAATGPGDWSAVVSGYRTFEAPGDIFVSQNQYDDRISLSWDNAQVPVRVAVAYEVWRALAGEPVENAQLLATVSGLKYDDTSADPGVGYSYWVRGVDEEGGVYGGFTAAMNGARSLFPPHQPDQTIGLSAAGQGGDNIYNMTGVGQNVYKRQRRVRTERFYSRLQNDGLSPDSFRIISTRSDKYFTVRLDERFGSFRNISASAALGAYRSDDLDVSDTRLYQMSVSPKRAAKKRRVRRTWYLWSVSTKDPEHQDRVKVSVKTPKPKKKR
jgi:fibronectin type 3 domain-containing protein